MRGWHLENSQKQLIVDQSNSNRIEDAGVGEPLEIMCINPPAGASEKI